MAQRLSTAQSAYLRQHAENPVDWWPWGKEAFAEAARSDLPVFVSIGYAACHWCHVMAHESFEDQDTADLLNERFVSIKVDREEHPDVDDAYMAATQAMTGQGGWPMSVFALPDGRVFHAGTYFPPQRMGQVPSFTEVLHAVHQAWTQRRDQVEEQAAKLAEALGRQRRRQSELATVVQTEHDGAPEPALRPEDLTELTDQVLAALAAEEDVVHGGFGSAPKFPPSPMLSWLVEESAWRLRSGQSAADDRAGGLAVHTMEAMARSALFDQVEGGFARYTVDRAWQLPHFEKMLYDNGQLLGAYARLSVHPAAGKQTQQRAARTARMTIDWLESRMLTEQGLLASSLDADTVQEDGARAEGATYLFSDDQLIQAARESGLSDAQAQRLAELNHGVPADEHTLRSGGPMNVSGNTPRTLHFDDPLSDDDLGLWEEVLPRLRQMRSARPQPNRDDKVVAAWNAQAVRSLAEAAALWDDPQLLEFAQGVAQRLWEVHAEPDQGQLPQAVDGTSPEQRPGYGSAQAREGNSTMIRRTSYAGRPGSGLGTLADHAQVVSMCCAIASAGADAGIWLDRAASVLRFLLREFIIAEAGSITVLESLDADGLLSQAQDGAADASPVDGPEPSSIALLAQAIQQAEALGLMLDLPWVKPTTHPGSRAGVPLRPADLLQHLGLIGPRAPLAVGGSLLAARRAAQGSPALRIFSGSAEDIAEVRRMGTLWGIPVEPTDGVVVGAEQQLRVSICLNDQASGVCLVSADTVDGAVQQL